MVKIMSTDIRTVKDMNGLIAYLAEKLEWKIDLDDFEDIEDISYDFDAEEIGLKEEAFAKIVSLWQLPPLVDGQKWGIFCVEFDSKRFEVTALRKILSGLIPKRRNSAEHAVWKQKDLLFICFWGNDNERTIGLAHFEDSDQGLPQIKMISCCPAVEDFTQIAVFENRLKNLKWPSNYLDHEKWQTDWSSAFVTGYKQTIRDASTLTIQLAAEAQEIKKRILAILEVETSNGYVHLLYDKFKDTLIHDMTESQFADMYAQTVVYGLFSARCMDKTQDDFSASEAIELIPNTNPFLKSLMKECLGSQNNTKLSFDELEIGNVVDLLLHTKTDSIIEDFNRQTGGGREDPVIHFYEEFLTAYDKNQKVQRGVFYTPQPVVKFIVNAVDSIIKNEFGYEDGLASTETKTVKYVRDSKRTVNGVKTKVEDTKEVPAIQVLDPATGTGTFLRETILRIYENFKIKNKNLNSDELKKQWNSYVQEHLLPRINGFELMMAPYAVAHMKLAMVLKDTGYDFNSDERLRVYLTNTLEEPGNSNGQLTFWDDPLASESIAANRVKKDNAINVVIGNPPYAAVSSNNGEWILNLIESYKKEPGGKIKLQEKNPKWINDDYVKFIRYAQMISDKSDNSIVAFICPHGFLTNPTFRGMRWKLLQTYDLMYFWDLHGNSNKKEVCPDGTKDENVFDIKQGVGIIILIKHSEKRSKTCRVYSSDLYGDRNKKYECLNKYDLKDIKFNEVNLAPPFLLFKQFNENRKNIYDKGFSVVQLFPLNGVGITTAHDDFVIGNTPNELFDRFNRFKNSSKDEDLYSKFNVKRKLGWDICEGWHNLQEFKDIKKLIHPICYRPFDIKYIFYEDKLVWRTVRKIMEHMLYDNIGLVTARSNKGNDSSQFFVANNMMETKYGERTTQSSIFPLYLYEQSFKRVIKRVNLNTTIVEKFEKILGKTFQENTFSSETFNEKEVFFYVYANVYSKKYRELFHEFLNIDFPKIPYPTNWLYFKQMAEYGEELCNIHLLKEQIPTTTALIGNGNNIVQKYKFDNGYVIINDEQYFCDVNDESWNFLIGGYQPLQKWLKDRKDLKLSSADVGHYIQMVSAINKTIEIMDKIDGVIELEL